MCGIIITNKQIENIYTIIKKIKSRGPDFTGIISRFGYSFIHLLLAITNFKPQPFDYGDTIILFNGEIYNYKNDGECIIDLYRRYNLSFTDYLDGEFSIVIYDNIKKIIIATTDIFGTKPLWIGLENGISIASYEHPLKKLNIQNREQLKANTMIVYDITKNTIIERRQIHKFNLTQYKTNINDFLQALRNAIIKRTNTDKKIFIGLSSGYDSGVIACELNLLGIPFTAYTIKGIENINILEQRRKIIKNHEYIEITPEIFLQQKDKLKNSCDKYYLRIDSGELTRYNELKKIGTQKQIDISYKHLFNANRKTITDDNGAIGLSLICERAIINKEKIFLSGSGADEIISDYGWNGVKRYGHSTIGGLFTKELSEIFPWKNFFDNTQRAYLMKEEYITGLYGIEGRYPFLDKYVVQEFLNLSVELKNKKYKFPLYKYLTVHKFPFEENVKIGFNCGYNSDMTMKSKSHITIN